MTVRILFRNIVIKYAPAYETARRYFEQFKILPTTVQTICLEDVKISVSPLVSQLTNLRTATVAAEPDVLAIVGEAAGTTLRDLVVSSSTKVALPVTVLAPFTGIATLQWSAFTALVIPDAPRSQHVKLPHLRSIHLVHSRALDGFADFEYVPFHNH